MAPKVYPVGKDVVQHGGADLGGGAAGTGRRKADLHGGKRSSDPASNKSKADAYMDLGGGDAHLGGGAAHSGVPKEVLDGGEMKSGQDSYTVVYPGGKDVVQHGGADLGVGAAGTGRRKADLHGGKRSVDPASNTSKADADGVNIDLGGGDAHLGGGAEHSGVPKEMHSKSPETWKNVDLAATQEDDIFIKGFYNVIVHEPHKLHLLYHKRCEITWTTPEMNLHLTSSQEVQHVMASNDNYLRCLNLQSYTVHVVKNNLHILSEGLCNVSPSCSFLQSLVVCRKQHLVVSDILTLFPEARVSPLSLKVKILPALAAVSNELSAAPTGVKDAQNALLTGTNVASRIIRFKVKSPTAPATLKKPDGEAGEKDFSTPIITRESADNCGTQKATGSCTLLNTKMVLRNLDRKPTVTTRSGRTIRLPKQYCGDSGLKLPLEPQVHSEMTAASELSAEASKKSTVCVVYHEGMLLHKELLVSKATEIIEVPERLSSVYNKFSRDGLLARCDVLVPEPATVGQLLLVHDSNYVDFVSKLPHVTAEDVAKFIGEDERQNIYFSDGTKEACFLAAGSVIRACDSIGQGHHEQAFCIVRPPGHHAKRNQAAGFCFFNNVAVGIQHLLMTYPLYKRILVVDFDVHHGNGTQSIFYNNEQVMVVSIHSSSVNYPFGEEARTGHRTFVGEGSGEGYNLNIDLAGKYGDGDLILLLEELVIPIAKDFKADAIFISAGYDAAKGDDAGDCKVSSTGFAAATEMIVKAGACPVIMVLEGGYVLPVLSECASYSLRALLGEHNQISKRKAVMPETKTRIAEMKNCMSRYWDVFKN